MINNKKDDRESHGWMKSNLDYDDTLNNSEGDKDEIIVSITSNDKVMHLPSLLKSMGETISKFTDEENTQIILNRIKKVVIDNERTHTERWEVPIPLLGPRFDKLVFQIYPTYASWKHLRDKNEM